jgi:hypothetical protein
MATFIDGEKLARLRDAAPQPRRSGQKDEHDAEALQRSRFRARKKVRQLARELSPQLFFTNTTRKLLLSEDSAKAAWARFVRLVDKRTGGKLSGEWGYLVVPELHKSGEHWHLHWITSAPFIEVNMLRACWKKAIGGKATDVGDLAPGNVYVKRLNTRGRQSAQSIASYLSKYITKGDHVALNKRRYITSKGLALLPKHSRWLRTTGSRNDAICELLQQWMASGITAQDISFFEVPARSAVWFGYAPAKPPPPPF